MNSFYEHQQDSIHFHYRCFDRIRLNGLIQTSRLRHLQSEVARRLHAVL